MHKVNIYCDESCHLEHDHEKVMVIGGIRCSKNLRKRICHDVLSIKKQHGISETGEIKWNKVSPCNLEFYKNLVDYFLSV